MMGTGFWGLRHIHNAHAQADAARAQSTAAQTKGNMRNVAEQLDKLTLISMAMWSLLQEVSDLTEKDLMERVRQLDLADGVADGKVTKQVAKCPQCDRAMSPRHSRCMYCGHEKLVDTAFGEVT